MALVCGCPEDHLARLVGRDTRGAPGRRHSVGNIISTVTLERGAFSPTIPLRAGQHLPPGPAGSGPLSTPVSLPTTGPTPSHTPTVLGIPPRGDSQHTQASSYTRPPTPQGSLPLPPSPCPPALEHLLSISLNSS